MSGWWALPVVVVAAGAGACALAVRRLQAEVAALQRCRRQLVLALRTGRQLGRATRGARRRTDEVAASVGARHPR
jgi:hypothetical protein